MVTGLIGRKAGMTQVFAEDGAAVPVTVLVAGPCVVLEVKTSEKHGYEAAQLGLLENKSVTKPQEGHAKKHGAPPTRIVREFAYDTKPEPGEKITVEIFKDMKYVDVSGTSKGRGFTGVIKRWGFKGGPKSHGSMFHREPGSIGASSFPSRVWKGMKMGGRYGNKRATAQNLEVIKVDPEKNLLLVRGAVPGHRKGYVLIRRAVKKHA